MLNKTKTTFQIVVVDSTKPKFSSWLPFERGRIRKNPKKGRVKRFDIRYVHFLVRFTQTRITYLFSTIHSITTLPYRGKE